MFQLVQKKQKKIIMLLFFVPILSFANTALQPVQQMLDGYANRGIFPGIQISISKLNGKSYTLVSGYANLKQKERISASSEFKFGSVIKAFTAYLLYEQLNQHKLRTDVTLSQLVEKYHGQPSRFLRHMITKHPFLAKVTLEQLITHTSLIFDEQQSIVYLRELILHRYKPVMMQRHILRALNHSRYSNTDHLFHYANVNYILLGQVLSMISGKPFPVLIKKAFNKSLRPYQDYHSFSEISKGLVNGYTPENIESLSVFADGKIVKQGAQHYIEVSKSYAPSYDDGPAAALITNSASLTQAIKKMVRNHSVFQHMVSISTSDITSLQQGHDGFELTIPHFSSTDYLHGVWHITMSDGVSAYFIPGDQWGFLAGALIFPKQNTITEPLIITYVINTDSNRLFLATHGMSRLEKILNKILKLYSSGKLYTTKKGGLHVRHQNR